ncbi:MULTISPECIES: hypothetical protein [unclassified Nocardioides]|uniref:hypothetical protein n=1 Tax=Nocardioides sp. URHA0032 TaxID=1380388 RepID=UPI00048CEC7F|nr:hypothetical protein [Nocardioides sp. URHA0032]
MTHDDWTGGGATALGTHAPATLASYTVLVSVRPSGVHDEMLEAPEVVAFADQFGRDATAIDGRVRDAFVRATAGHTAAVANMIWIADVAPRVRVALDALFGPSETWPGRRRYPVADTGDAISSFLESISMQVDAHHDASNERPDAARAALAIAEAMIRTPAAMPDSVVAAAHELLTPAEAVEAVLDGARRSAGKIETALAA